MFGIPRCGRKVGTQYYVARGIRVIPRDKDSGTELCRITNIGRSHGCKNLGRAGVRMGMTDSGIEMDRETSAYGR